MYGAGGELHPGSPSLYFSGQNPPYDGIRTLPQSLFGEKGLIKGQPQLQTVFSLSLMVPILATLWVLWVFRTARNKKYNEYFICIVLLIDVCLFLKRVD